MVAGGTLVLPDNDSVSPDDGPAKGEMLDESNGAAGKVLLVPENIFWPLTDANGELAVAKAINPPCEQN
jgi:hypothetical protein